MKTTNIRQNGMTDMTCPRCSAMVSVGGGVCMRCGYALQADDHMSVYLSTVELLCEAMGLDRNDAENRLRAESALGWLGSHGWNLVRSR